MGTLRYTLSLLLWLCLWLSTTATNATFRLDYPYSEAFPDMQEQIAQCSAVSQFSFRNRTEPTPTQLARMCSDPNCATIANKFLKTSDWLKNANSSAMTSAFNLFTVPMLNYCWYYRLPGEKCPANPLVDLATHYKDKTDACARGTNVSYLEPNGTTFFTSVKEYMKAVTPILSSGNMSVCSRECTELSIRVYYLYKIMPCDVHDTKDKDQRTINSANGFMFFTCNLPSKGQDAYYKFQPDWPLPPIPESIPTPPATGSQEGSHASESPTAGHQVGNDDEDQGTVAGGMAVSESPTVPSPKPQSGIIRSSAKTEDTTGSSFSVSPRQNPSTSPTAAPLDSRSVATKQPLELTEDNGSLVPTTPSPAKGGASGGSKRVVLASVFAVAVLVAFIVFVWKRRHRRDDMTNKPGLFGHDDVTDTATSVADQYTVLTDPPYAPSSLPDGDMNAANSIGFMALLTAGMTPSTWPDSAVSLQKTVPTDSIKDIRLIGAGGSGVVFLVQDTRTNRLLASKRLAKNQLSTDKITAFHDEIQLVSKFDHPCIVSYIGATWTNRSDLQALFEYMDGGDLRTHLDSTPVEPWSNEKLEIAINIADALVYVHVTLATPIVHRDLKSRNILLTRTPQLRAKLSDFGVARHQSQHESMTTGVGTSRWLAPEVIVGGGTYDAACDIYSFGVVLSELDTHRVPFADCCDDGPLPEITILGMVGLDGLKPTFSDSCPPELLLLAQRCLSFDPRDRPSAETIASELRRIRDGYA